MTVTEEFGEVSERVKAKPRRSANRGIALAGRAMGRVLHRYVQRRPLHFPVITECLASLPLATGIKFRSAAYEALLPGFGRDVVMMPGAAIADAGTTLGCDVWVSRHAYIDFAHVSDHVLIGPHAAILAGGAAHNSSRIDIPIKSQGNGVRTAIKIGSGAWIGAAAVVMADVGEHAIVGAGTVVTKPVPAYHVVVGNPARMLRDRREQQEPEVALLPEEHT